MLGLDFYVCPLARILPKKSPAYGPGQSGYSSEDDLFEGNEVTGSELRFNRSAEAFGRVPQARLGGASLQWVFQSCQQFKYLFEHIGEIETPFLLFSAENEQIVNPGAHLKFVDRAQGLGKECQGYSVADAQHELLIEKDNQRQAVLEATLSYFSRYH
jgi:lysophospholipase